MFFLETLLLKISADATKYNITQKNFRLRRINKQASEYIINSRPFFVLLFSKESPYTGNCASPRPPPKKKQKNRLRRSIHREHNSFIKKKSEKLRENCPPLEKSLSRTLFGGKSNATVNQWS